MTPGFILAAGAGVAAAAAGTAIYGVIAPNSPLFGPVIGRGPRSGKHLYLTFDDGPARDTGRVLDALAQESVPAAFFVLGSRVARDPGTARAAAEAGHEVGNHTFTHPKLHWKGRRSIVSELFRTHQAIEAATDRVPRVFRAPHGYRNPIVHAVAHEFRYRVFGWTIGIWDSDNPGVEEIRRRVRSRLCPGAIVLLHDGDAYDAAGDRSQTAAALPGIVRDARDLGYTFRPLTDFLAPSGAGA